VVATVMAIILTINHLRHYLQPDLQRYVVRILLMVPIYSIDSWFSFRLHWWGVYFDTIRDCYEAFVIYNFFSLLVNMLGGYEKTKDLFQHYRPLRMPPPLCCFQTKTKRGLLGHCRRLILQYVLIRPVATIAASILHSQHKYCSGSFSPSHGYIYITLINFISVTCSVYGLVLFYLVASDSLKEYKPLLKFFAIKFVLFLTFWQTVIVIGLFYFKLIPSTPVGWTQEDFSDGLQNFLLCTEMLIAAGINYKAFPYQEYLSPKGQDIRTNVFHSFLEVANPIDMIRDIKHGFTGFFTKRKQRGERRSLLADGVAKAEIHMPISEAENNKL